EKLLGGNSPMSRILSQPRINTGLTCLSCPSNNPAEQVYSKRPLRTDYWHRQLDQVRGSGSYRDVAYQVGRLVAFCAAFLHISTMAFVCSLNESNCLLMNSVWIFTTCSKFFAWLSFCTSPTAACNVFRRIAQKPFV